MQNLPRDVRLRAVAMQHVARGAQRPCLFERDMGQIDRSLDLADTFRHAAALGFSRDEAKAIMHGWDGVDYDGPYGELWQFARQTRVLCG